MEKYINLDKTTLVKLLAERDENINEILNCENNEISVLEVWKDMRLEVYQQASGNRHEPNCSDDSTKMFSLADIDEIFEKVAEKQGEQSKQHLYDIIIALWDLLDKIDTFSDLQIDNTNPDNPFRKIEDITQERHKFVKFDGYNLFIENFMITNDKNFEKQGEQKPNDKVEPKFKVGDTIVDKDPDEYNYETIKDIKNEKYIFTDGYCISINEQEGWQLVKTPTITEQKTTNNIEPKFKVGDWVVWDNKISCHIDNIYQGKESLMYTITDVHNMTRSYSVKGFDNNAHLWTIQDAKDGDILTTKDAVFIFKHMDKAGLSLCRSYCEVIGNSELGLGFDFPIQTVHPATIEQGELLIKTINEAGYVWDFEHKELKQIKQNLAWSEEDDYILNLVSKFTSKGYESHPKIPSLEFVQDWLKSLKERYTWKPTDEQMEALLSKLPVIKGSGDKVQDILESLYQDLKKLKEE